MSFTHGRHLSFVQECPVVYAVTKLEPEESGVLTLFVHIIHFRTIPSYLSVSVRSTLENLKPFRK